MTDSASAKRYNGGDESISSQVDEDEQKRNEQLASNSCTCPETVNSPKKVEENEDHGSGGGGIKRCSSCGRLVIRKGISIKIEGKPCRENVYIVY